MINSDRILQAIEDAFEATVVDFYEECQNQLEVARWSWPHRTVTKSRGVKGSPREISDTGELSASGSVEIYQKSGRLTWTAKHATTVYFGFTSTRGNVYPGRPWVEAAIEELDLVETMAKHLEKRLS